MTSPNMQEAREIGQHIFRWGLSCEDCTPEDFKIEMAKAVKQVALALSKAEARGRLAGLEEGAKVAENFKVRTATDEMVGIIRASGAGIASAIRQIGEV